MPKGKTVKVALLGAAAVLIGFSTFALGTTICIPSGTVTTSRA
ncbi:hypothetical protein [Streptomyces sp. 351MFTsu5.1]|nr:hypothetical protein [Streptomyces sp. 351MFTsu5.1]